MNRMKKLVAVALSTVAVAGVGVVGGSLSAGASGTGAGLAEYALNAYYEGWSYVWGGTSPGAVDCSGLIWSYCGGDRLNMRDDAQANGRDWGYVSDGIPRVHGLGLSRPNHVGVYIEDGMEVDARGSDYGVCYQQIGENGYNNWDCWFKLTAVTYPEEGWESFNGNYYYYENGEYIVDTSRTIDGVTYYFDSKGHSGTTPADPSSTAESSSSSSSSSGSKSQPTSWSKGSNGDEVVKIQTRLAELGYYNGPIDGDFGDMTDAAFRAFQLNAGLTVDGIAGADREVLYADSAPAAKVEEATEPATEPEPTEAPTEAPTEEPTEAPTEPAVTEIEATDAPKAAPVIVAQIGDFSDTVTSIQDKLAELGYFGLESSGFYGDFTEEAVRNFQTANGLTVTGSVDAATFEKLYSDDAVESVLPPVGADLVSPITPDVEPLTELVTEPVDEPKTAPATEPVTEPVIETEPETEPETEAETEAVAEPETEAVIEPETEAETEPETEAETEAVIDEIPVLEDNTPIAVFEPVAEPEEETTQAATRAGVLGNTTTAPTVPASTTATKANEVTAKALEDAAGSSSQTSDMKKSPSIWLWLLLAAAVLGVIAFILLMHSRKQTKAEESTKGNLNDRW